MNAPPFLKSPHMRIPIIVPDLGWGASALTRSVVEFKGLVCIPKPCMNPKPQTQTLHPTPDPKPQNLNHKPAHYSAPENQIPSLPKPLLTAIRAPLEGT